MRAAILKFLVLPFSKNRFEFVRFPAKENSWAGSTLNSSPSCQGSRMFCACKQSIRYWSSVSLLIGEFWQDQSILIASADYWALIWTSQCIFRFSWTCLKFSLKMPDIILSQKSTTISLVQFFKKQIKLYTRWKFLVSYNVIFRVGSIRLTSWSLYLQTLGTYNNQYPRPLETPLYLQRCPEGISLSFPLSAAPFRISEWSAE